MAESRERPILFSGAMVRALLDGRKTQTRRVMKPQPEGERWLSELYLSGKWAERPTCPYGQPGDRLWVRETWGVMSSEGSTALVSYAARLPAGKTLADTDGGCDVIRVPDEWRGRLEGLVDTERWRPSIHMPRWASRLTLKVTGVRVERLHDISEADARAEGVDHELAFTEGLITRASDTRPRAVAWFQALWDRINGADSWDANPWVWVVEVRAP